MALETWLIKVKKTISHSFDSVRATTNSIPPHHHHHHHHHHKLIIKKSSVGVLAFEIAGIMPKLHHLWLSLSDKHIAHLRSQSLSLEGVRKIVSNDEAFLLGLACAEMVENLRVLAKSVARLSKRCQDSSLRNFDDAFDAFANTGRDQNGWSLSWKDMEAKNMKKMERYVTITATLYREMDELSVLENSLKKSLQCKDTHHQKDQMITSSAAKQQKILDLQQKLVWQRQEVKYLKERSLWSRSFDTVTSLLARSIFTILARIKLVFAVGHGFPMSLPRSLSASATVYPSHQNPPDAFNFVSGPLIKSAKHHQAHNINNINGLSHGFFEVNSKVLKPPRSTLGAAALALHYANLVIVMEKMIKSPQLVGCDARDDLYSMLPSSIRSSLRGRLRGIGFSASDPVLAGEWRDALGKILGWLSPLAHNMIKWHSERSFEQQQNHHHHHVNMPAAKTNVLLLQTLYFANKEKTEAAITELLVGLNYIWRFEREMTAQALFDCTNFSGLFKLQQPSS